MYNDLLETVFDAFARKKDGHKKNLPHCVDCIGHTWAM
jgi:hypothetical protein